MVGFNVPELVRLTIGDAIFFLESRPQSLPTVFVRGALFWYVGQLTAEGDDLFGDAFGMFIFLSPQLDKFFSKLGVVHSLGMLFEQFALLHFFDVSLPQNIDGLKRLISRKIEKAAPPFRPVLAIAHTIL